MADAANRFRQNRIRRFVEMLDRVIAAKGSVRVLDLGGTKAYWDGLESVWRDRPVSFTIVNVGLPEIADERFTQRPGDARNLTDVANDSFDIVHSNSVIEHVGHWAEMRAMADEVRRLAPSYFLQTPNMWFPVEAHFKLPFIHWLPEQARAAWLLRPAGKYLPADAGLHGAMNLVQRVNLLSAHQLQTLFPDAKIERERVFGFTKSLIAIREG